MPLEISLPSQLTVNTSYPSLDDKRRAEHLFSKVLARSTAVSNDATLILVTHALPDNEVFSRFLATVFPRLVIIPKPDSIDPATLSAMSDYSIIARCDKVSLRQPTGMSKIREMIGSTGPVVIADMGGYFAEGIGRLAKMLDGRLAGVVEDTTNGHARYESRQIPCPVVSIARSPIKEPEDVIVGRIIALSVQAALKEVNETHLGQEHLVIGFGRIGRSAGFALVRDGAQVAVYDIDPLKRAEARAYGFPTPERVAAIRWARCIISATGNKGLAAEDLSHLRGGCIIASVTSPDDEFDFDDLDRNWQIVGHSPTCLTFGESEKRTMRLVNGGRAANFLYGAAVGATIYLVHAAVLHAISQLLSGGMVAGIQELKPADQRLVATLWGELFEQRAGSPLLDAGA